MKTQFRNLPTAFKILLVGIFVNQLGGCVTPFLAIYLSRAKGFSTQYIGIVATVMGLGMFIAGPVGGYLSDHIGRKKTMVLSLALSSLSILLLLVTSSQTLLLVVCFIHGLISECYRPATSAIVADIVPREDRTYAYGLIYWAINLGFSISALLAGFFAAKNFTLLFMIDAMSSLLYACIVFYFIAEPQALAKRISRSKGLVFAAFKNRKFTGLFLLNLVSQMIFMQAMVALPLDMQFHGNSPHIYGYLISLNGVMVSVLQPFISRWKAGFSSATILQLSAVLMGFGFSMNAWANSLYFYVISVVVWTLGEILSAGIVPTLVVDLAPIDQRGRYQGMFQMSFGTANLLAPMAGTFVMTSFGSSVLWYACLANAVFLFLGHQLITRKIEAGNS